MSKSNKSLRPPLAPRRTAPRGYAEQRVNAVDREIAVQSGGHSTVKTTHGNVPQTAVAEREATVGRVESTVPVETLDEGGMYVDDDADEEGLGESAVENAGHDQEGSTTTKYSKKNHPIIFWLGLRMEYLWAVLRLDGRPMEVINGIRKGCAHPKCPNPRAAESFYRCVSGCLCCSWICQACMVNAHATRPLCRIEIWVDDQWQPLSLRQLGLKVQLGHWAGGQTSATGDCNLTRETNKAFVVIHTNGLHEVHVEFCGCTSEMVPMRDQLMGIRWWPATTDKPKTAATFEVLDAFNAHSATGKDNAYDFYNALEALTDGAGLINLPYRCKELFRMAHQYRHILATKRGGRGHDLRGGIAETQWGELAQLCPACHHRGINDDIVDQLAAIAPELAEAYLSPLGDIVQLSTDCNFRAKNRNNLSTAETSPYLGDGMAFMVPDSHYDDHTQNSKWQEELSSCSRFGAMLMANLKEGRGLRTTGIGAVFCSRHEFFWPNSVGTLVKGERYCTMDFILASALRRVRAGSLQLYYDIVCQFTRNLHKRMLAVEPSSFIFVGARKLVHDLNVTFGVPKFHNPGHLVTCQLWFNISYMVGAGNTDGEASERAWAGLNPAASSLREMGPGTMRDTIDFFCGAWNWRKFINMGNFLDRKLAIALIEASDHSRIYTGITNAVSDESEETVVEWVGDAVAFEQRRMLDKEGRPVVKGKDAVKNPYESRTKKMSLDKARLASTAITAQAMKTSVREDSSGATEGAREAAAVTNFVLKGFKIETLQWRASRPRSSRTVIQKTGFLQQCMELERQVRLFRKDQQWLMPTVYAGIQELEGVESGGAEGGDDESDEDGEDGAEAAVKTVTLYLPSELSRTVARSMLKLMLEELKLRWAGMEDWLDQLRQQLQVRGSVHRWRVDFVTGQHASTRAIGKQKTIEGNIQTAKAMYQLHRRRYVTLLSYLEDNERLELVPANWEETFQELNDGDCVALSHRLLLRADMDEIKHIRRILGLDDGGVASAQGSHKISWIWYKVSEGSELELNDDLRVEFVKCRARSMRWVEEVFKLAFEMVRVPEFCETRCEWWQERAELVYKDLDAELQDGVRAYAKKQANMYRRHAQGLRERFKKPLAEVGDFVKRHGLDGLQIKPHLRR